MMRIAAVRPGIGNSVQTRPARARISDIDVVESRPGRAATGSPPRFRDGLRPIEAGSGGQAAPRSENVGHFLKIPWSARQQHGVDHADDARSTGAHSGIVTLAALPLACATRGTGFVNAADRIGRGLAEF